MQSPNGSQLLRGLIGLLFLGILASTCADLSFRFSRRQTAARIVHVSVRDNRPVAEVHLVYRNEFLRRDIETTLTVSEQALVQLARAQSRQMKIVYGRFFPARVYPLGQEPGALTLVLDAVMLLVSGGAWYFLRRQPAAQSSKM